MNVFIRAKTLSKFVRYGTLTHVFEESTPSSGMRAAFLETLAYFQIFLKIDSPLASPRGDLFAAPESVRLTDPIDEAKKRKIRAVIEILTEVVN